MNEDPSVRLTRVAEQLAQAQEGPDRWALFRKVATVGALVVVLATCAMVGFIVYQQATSTQNAAVASCRSEYAAAVQLGMARAVSELLQQPEDITEEQKADLRLSLNKLGVDLNVTAEEHLAAATRAPEDPQQSNEECKRR